MNSKLFWIRSVENQKKWIENHGSDLVGYIDNYHGTHGRTVDESVKIYESDCAELTRRIERLRLCK